MAWNSKKYKSTTHTSLEIKDEVTGEPLGLVLTGYTPDSNEWAAAAKAQARKSEKQSMILEKGQSRIELERDAGEKQKALTVSMITGATENGKAVGDVDDLRSQLLHNADVQWIYEQWHAHVNDRANFFDKPAPVPKTTSAA